ncbi:hypothetical protein Syn7502_01482 [Synechococcus sp. PCC 7502]|uniref:hypothetical protein n=1 Tax=Synechococcus sp. PCC 7502 TaxID=1173263 RepID=UPI00029F95C2|nr:hypothetical protein [Synechococcus sp. PCC 7502]AFY73550.1 hypothetical protein Syn7502_01482 [Synechococcus sp. PCC 7502]
MNQTLRSLHLLWEVDSNNYPIARAYLSKLGVQLPKNPSPERVRCAMVEVLSKSGLTKVSKNELRVLRKNATEADKEAKHLAPYPINPSKRG